MMPEERLPDLVCPDCRTELRSTPERLDCVACGGSYQVRDGIPTFAELDEFYEFRYEPVPFNYVPDERYPWHRLVLYLVSMHYLWYVRRYLRQHRILLDVACGGGTRYLCRDNTVIGLDVSLESAKCLQGMYAGSVQANALRIPFPDGSFDGIVSKFFLEHVPLDQKPALLTEFFRLLKPGGRAVLLFDCDCMNPLWRWAKLWPELFDQAFIQNDGHYGLILPSDALALLRQQGFRVLAYRAMNKTHLVHLPMLNWLQVYRGKSRALDFVLLMGQAIRGQRLLNFAYTFAVTLWDDVVERFLPLDRARYLLVVCEKRE